MKKHESIHFTHETVYYVPCFQVNPGKLSRVGNSSQVHTSYPSFEYSMSDATTDEQMAWSLNPDYVLKLVGKFDAKTQPFDESIDSFNKTGELHD